MVFKGAFTLRSLRPLREKIVFIFWYWFVLRKLPLSLRERVGVRGNKKRVSILIEEEVIRHAKKRAAQEGRSLSDLTQDALVSYLSEKVPELFCMA